MTRAAGSPRRWSPLDHNPFALEYLDEPDQLSRIAERLADQPEPDARPADLMIGLDPGFSAGSVLLRW